jgi:hypothetical protein
MGNVRPIPNPGDVFTDVRDDDRTMRVSYHADVGMVVVSLWAGRLCRASFRLAADEANRLIGALSEAVARADADGPVVEPPVAVDGPPDGPAVGGDGMSPGSACA